jgi:ERCC4-type nuclease
VGRPPNPKPILIVDTREQHPFDFDGDEAFEAIEHIKLDQGDYSLKGLEHIVSIERKASANELYTNLSSKTFRERFYAEAKRLEERVKFRFIIVEQDCEDIFNPSSYAVNTMRRNKFSAYMPPAVVLEHLICFMLQHNIHVLFAGNKAKSVAKKILLEVHDMHLKGQFNDIVGKESK